MRTLQKITLEKMPLFVIYGLRGFNLTLLFLNVGRYLRSGIFAGWRYSMAEATAFLAWFPGGGTHYPLLLLLGMVLPSLAPSCQLTPVGLPRSFAAPGLLALT